MGEAATLTIACMFGDIYQYLADQGLEITPTSDVAVRFSLPNWTGDDAEHSTARRRMFGTAVVSVGLIASEGWASLPKLGSHVNIDDWRARIKAVRNSADTLTLLSGTPATFANMVEQDYAWGPFKFRLAAESSAAGFPPLEDLLRDVPKKSTAQKHWAKLLVVDVGAGSTDAGYFVSSRRLADDELLLNYLPPARTLDFAGEQLTELLQEFYIQQRRRELIVEEAEVIKVNAPHQWIDQEFVRDWRSRIAKSVADYIFQVPDEARLGEPAIPGLKIVLTGGSGVVSGLDTAIRDRVISALERRGVQSNVAARTEVLPLRSRFVKDIVDASRRAVSIGAAQPDFASLAYREKFTPAAKVRVTERSWV